MGDTFKGKDVEKKMSETKSVKVSQKCLRHFHI